MTATALKFLMVGLMVVDHIRPFVSATAGAILHLISRPVAPVFAYLAMESYKHTSNKVKYMGRLYISAIIMEVGNYLVNNFLITNPDYYVTSNIFLTLALGVFAIHIYENDIKDRKRKIGYAFIAAIVLIGFFFAEGGIYIIPFMLISHIYEPGPAIIIFIGATVIFGGMSYVDYGSMKENLIMLANNSDFLFISGVPFLYLYNGERGSDSKFTKYFFYTFYPLHLWILGIMASSIL